MPVSFIALQCFQCSTMQQVKQQKKSSNRWCCVACNEKQSVRKVFAQSFMAKDVRKFVQNFNMSRQLSDQKQIEELYPSDSSKDEQKRKRNYWSEYVDNQEEYCGRFNKDGDLTEGDDGFEAMVVTEMPKALFKKPKVKECYSNRNAEKLMKPQFPNRSNATRHKNVHSQEWNEVEESSRVKDNCSLKEPMTLNQLERASKWNRLGAQIKGIRDENNGVGVEPAVRISHSKEQNSKWSNFITDEEDNAGLESRGRIDSQSNDPLEFMMNDQRVVDDIYPDFL